MTVSRNRRTRRGLAAAGAGLAAAVWMALCVGRLDFGAQGMLAFSGVCLIYALAAGRDTPAARVLCRVLEAGTALAAALVLAISLALNGYAHRTAVGGAEAEYLVVFGAGVQGERPSLMLTLRTRAAYEYLAAHPRTRAVLTGGQGPDEAISEAEAMRRLLTGWGIAEERLIPEPQATDTIENGRYAMELIGDPDAEIAAVSNTFHLYRCAKALRDAGARRVRTMEAPLPSMGVAASMYLRECCAVAYHAVFG